MVLIGGAIGSRPDPAAFGRLYERLRVETTLAIADELMGAVSSSFGTALPAPGSGRGRPARRQLLPSQSDPMIWLALASRLRREADGS